MALLHAADPDARKIAAYLASGEVWVDAQGAAIAIIQPHSPDVFEIMNIALAEHMPEQRHGKAFMEGLNAMLKGHRARAVDIGTSNSSLNQLALYQRLSFRITGIVVGFIDDYCEPIVENGVACRDMVRLRVEL